MPATINDLPPELLHHVLGQLRQDTDAAALLAASLVARYWRAPAQAALWNNIIVLGTNQVEDLLESGAIGQHKRRSLGVEVYPETSASTLELLAALVDLRSLTVCLLPMDGTARSIGSLIDESWIFRGYLRGLKSLHLDLAFRHEASGSTTPAFALSSLYLGGTTDSRCVIHAILASSASTLTTLTLHYPSEEAYEVPTNSLSLVGNTLKSLTLLTETECNIPAAGFATLIPAFASLDALKELYITVDELETAILAVESLPSPVAVLEVDYEGRVDARDSSAATDLLARIGGAAWSGLRRFQVGSTFMLQLMEMDKGPELSQLCAERGIDFY